MAHILYLEKNIFTLFSDKYGQNFKNMFLIA